MRRLLLGTALGLCLAAGPAARATDLKGAPAGGGPVPSTPGVATVPDKEPTCGRHGTTIDFVDTPAEAAKQARKEGKLVLVLHISGIFEDPKFT
jgi:hypothetical protein